MTTPAARRGPIEVLVGWFRSVRDNNSNLAALTMCGLGLFMLSRGLERWRVVAFMHDTGASRSPVPYRAPFPHWGRVVPAGAGDAWFIVVSSADRIPAACETAAAAPRSFPRRLTVLAADEVANHGTSSCASFTPGGNAAIPVVSASYAKLGSNARDILQNGVALLDQDLAVRYASRRPADLSRMGSILENYAADTRLAAAKQ